MTEDLMAPRRSLASRLAMSVNDEDNVLEVATPSTSKSVILDDSAKDDLLAELRAEQEEVNNPTPVAVEDADTSEGVVMVDNKTEGPHLTPEEMEMLTAFPKSEGAETPAEPEDVPMEIERETDGETDLGYVHQEIEPPVQVVPESHVFTEEPKPQEPVGAMVLNPSKTAAKVFETMPQPEEVHRTKSSDAYASMVEGLVSEQCQISGVTNLDLNTYGAAANKANYSALDVIEFGRHKFLGVKLTDAEVMVLTVKLATHIALSQNATVAVSIVKEITNANGIKQYSLIYPTEVIQLLADTFGYRVSTNINTHDISQLFLAVQK